MFCRVAVNYPVLGPGLTYAIPEGMELAAGDIIDVPLGKRRELGCVLETGVAAPDASIKTKDVLGKREDYPALHAEDLRLMQWVGEYYHYGVGQLIADCLPNTKKRPRPLQSVVGEGIPFEYPATESQAKVIGAIRATLGTYARHLVHGVTGSGKTLVFQELILATLARGQSALYLLPEINLTPQFIETFQRHVPVKVHAFHSEVTASEKYLIWKEAAAGVPALYIGVRSAVFLPVRGLGLIVIDEEHDSSFKQEDRCPYHARDVATKKAQIAGCPVVLGSATPALETWYQYARAGGDAHYHPLPERVGGAQLPTVRLVDTRNPTKSRKPGEEDTWPLVASTVEVLRGAHTRGEQALVFINRLGFANYVQCRACGHQFQCPNCSVTLRFFRQKNVLSCQHCEYIEPMPDGCPKCTCLTLVNKGFGTERVEGEVKRLMPAARVERFDRDEVRTFTALKDKLERFHAGGIDIMVGTQMLSKGHNFRRVKKVVVLGMDNQLNYPDFRAGERVWQTVVQVAGRAGRYSTEGEVFIQTASPDSPLFATIAKQSLDDFYHAELPLREMSACPPFRRLVSLYFTGRFQDKLVAHMVNVVTPLLHGLCDKHFPCVQVLGPRPANLEKKANQYTWTVLLKSQDLNQLHNMVRSFRLNWDVKSGISLKVDVDPQHLG